jgi:GTP-binding protein
MIEYYLKKRQELKMVVLLVDIRHEPSENDQLMANWIRGNGFEPVVIATKADKIKRSQLQKHLSMIRKGLSLKNENHILPFSSMTKQGKDEIWSVIETELGLNIEEE